MTNAKGRTCQLKIIAGEELDKARLLEWLARCGTRKGENRWPLQVRVFDGDSDTILAADTMFHAGEFTRSMQEPGDGDGDGDEAPRGGKGGKGSRAAERAVDRAFDLLASRPDVVSAGMDRLTSLLGGGTSAAGTGINRAELRQLVRLEIKAVLEAIEAEDEDEEDEELEELTAEVGYLRDQIGRLMHRLELLEDEKETARKVVTLERA